MPTSPDHLTPADQLRVVNLLLANVNNVPGLGNIRGGHAFAMELLAGCKRRLSRPVVFKWLGDEGAESVFEVGHYGGATQTLRTSQRGVWWLWAAIADRGVSSTLRASDFSAPWATASGDSTRKALRRDAADFFDQLGMHELAQAASYIKVTHGLIRYCPAVNAPTILTR